MLRSGFAILAALGLAACATTTDSARPSKQAMAELTPDKPLAELPVQNLTTGQCGMVLWQRMEPARRIIFIVNTPAEARLVHKGKVVRLTRTDMSGGMQFGHAPQQRFDGRDVSLEIDVKIAQREGLVDGAVIPEGSVTYGPHGGASVVLPVIGLIGCE